MGIKNFVSSIGYDIVLTKYDISGSIAHTKMLAKCKIISPGDAGKIIKGLSSILKDFEKGKIKFTGEDIHTSIEKELEKRIGPAAGKMHTARSRNDQVVLAERLYLKTEISTIIKKINNLNAIIKKFASKHTAVIMPGFTHLQNAQPVLLSHWFLAYAWMFKRDKERFSNCYKMADVMPLGAAAFAGTEFPIDRDYVAKLLGFSSISENSVDTVSDRDFIIEFLFAVALMSLHLSRLAEEIIIWSSQPFGFIQLSGKFTTGSSIMPQKKNPDFSELVKGKTGRLYGNLLSLMTVMKGLPLSYNRDMQEDKEPMFDSAETIKATIDVSAQIVSTMEINSERMFFACKDGFILATDVADCLVSKGIPFRTAHAIVGKIVKHCLKHKKTFEDLSVSEWKSFSGKFDNSIYSILDMQKAIEKRTSYGGTSPASVKNQLKKL